MSKQKNKNQWLYVALAVVLIVVVSYLKVDSSAVSSPSPTTSPTQIVLGATSTPTPTPTTTSIDWYEVYFTSPKIPFDNIVTGGIENHLIEKINASQSSIDLAVYEFDLEDVAQALIAAHNRGVNVRVIYDNEFSDPDPQIAEVQKAGIKTVPDNRNAFMHNKFFVFDGTCIWTGSFNISVNAAYRNNENALYFCSDEVAKNYTTEFNELFSGKFGASSPADTPFPEFTIQGIKIENYFAPEDHVMDQVVAEVLTAKESIHFMAFSFTSDSLGKAMIDDMEKQVKVQGVFESPGADSQYSECKPLLDKGADVTLDGNPRTFHHKVIIVDGETVILGSFNFSNSANEENDENLLIIHDRRLAQEYEKEFQRMKASSLQPVGGVCKTK